MISILQGEIDIFSGEYNEYKYNRKCYKFFGR